MTKRSKRKLRRAVISLMICLTLAFIECSVTTRAEEKVVIGDDGYPIVQYLPDIVDNEPLSVNELIEVHKTVVERQESLEVPLLDDTEEKESKTIVIEDESEQETSEEEIEDTTESEEEPEEKVIDTSVKIFESESFSAENQHEAKRLADQYGIPLEILISLIYRESTYQSGVVSADGRDYGLCQIRDINHEWINSQLGKQLNYIDDIDSMEACCFMLSNLYNKYSYNGWHYILMAYNGGEGYASNHYADGIYSSEYSRAVIDKAYELGWDG